MKTINKDKLIELFRNLKGSTFIGFSSITNVNALKKNKINSLPNPYGEIFKLSKVSACANFDFAHSVNLQREREGNQEAFVAKPRTWGRLVSPSLVEHKGKYYLQVKVEKTRKPIYLIRDVKTNAFKYVKKNEIAAYLPEKNESSRQDVDKQVIIRDYSIDNIHSIVLNKETYKIKD